MSRAGAGDIARAGRVEIPGVDSAIFGMTDGREIRPCVSVDSRHPKSCRQEKPDAEIENESSDRAVPNIAVAGILTQ